MMAAFLPPCIFAALVVLRLFGLLIPYSIPNGAMAPAVSAGDHIIMEGMTFLRRSPHRGDIIVFKTDGLAISPPSVFIKRVAGEPGDHLRLSDGKLYINDKQVTLSNAVGEITYDLPPQLSNSGLQTDVTVPEGCFYVLGDNSLNSSDSRFWGSVPRKNIMGIGSLCIWPPRRMGKIK